MAGPRQADSQLERGAAFWSLPAAKAANASTGVCGRTAPSCWPALHSHRRRLERVWGAAGRGTSAWGRSMALSSGTAGNAGSVGLCAIPSAQTTQRWTHHGLCLLREHAQRAGTQSRAFLSCCPSIAFLNVRATCCMPPRGWLICSCTRRRASCRARRCAIPPGGLCEHAVAHCSAS